MSKTYDFGKKSDLRRFHDDLLDDIVENAKEDLLDQEYDLTCPNCSSVIQMRPGKYPCPKCGEMIDLNLGFEF